MMMVAVTIASLPIALQDIDAHHYSQRRWEGTSVDLCYDSYSLRNLRIDNNPNQYTKVKQQLDIARNDWNDEPSRFTLNLIGGQYCRNWIYANAMTNGEDKTAAAAAMICVRQGSGERCAIAELPRDFPTGYITRASVTFNTRFDWFTTAMCPSDLDIKKRTLSYVARHEFGHWVSFDHTFGFPYESVMYASYDCSSRNSVKPADSAELSSIYG